MSFTSTVHSTDHPVSLSWQAVSFPCVLISSSPQYEVGFSNSLWGCRVDNSLYQHIGSPLLLTSPPSYGMLFGLEIPTFVCHAETIVNAPQVGRNLQIVSHEVMLEYRQCKYRLLQECETIDTCVCLMNITSSCPLKVDIYRLNVTSCRLEGQLQLSIGKGRLLKIF